MPGAADVAYALASASKASNLAGLKCAMLVTGSPAILQLAIGRIADALQDAP